METDKDKPPRKPYSPPKLTRLGTVRELTLGGGASIPDAGSMLMMTPGR